MERLSRARTWPIVLPFFVFAGMETLAIYVFVLNRRLTRDLIDHTWREPTIIRSGKHVVVTTLYGVNEPPAITYDTFRRWANELKRIFGK